VLGDPRFASRWGGGKRVFFPPLHTSRPVLGPTQLLFTRYLCPSQESMRPGREGDHSSLCSAEIEWSYTSASPYGFVAWKGKTYFLRRRVHSKYCVLANGLGRTEKVSSYRKRSAYDSSVWFSNRIQSVHVNCTLVLGWDIWYSD
jgi:hypothetical protein